MSIFSHIKRWPALLALMMLFGSCKITKHIKEGEYLVEKNKFIDEGKTKIPEDELEAFIRQKPNRRILGIIPFNLWLYNQIDQEKVYRKKDKRNEKYDRINAKRIEKNNKKNEKRGKKGKKPREPKLKDKEKSTFGESLIDASEPPVIFDSAAMLQTANQVTRFLSAKGYFYAKVKDSVAYDQKNKRAKVFYILRPGLPYKIESVNYSIKDTAVSRYIRNDSANCLIKKRREF